MAKLQRGKVAIEQTPEITEIRELSRADLTHLAQPRPPTQLTAIRDSHHRVARAIAAGLSNSDISAICGVSYSRVSILRKDPAMEELVAHYRGLVTAEWLAQQDHMMEVATSNMLKAEQMLSDKIDDAIESGEHLPTRDLVAITEGRMDRFGYGKTQKNLNVNVDFAANLEAARRRSSRARDPRVIEARPQSEGAAESSSTPTSQPSPPSFRRF